MNIRPAMLVARKPWERVFVSQEVHAEAGAERTVAG